MWSCSSFNVTRDAPDYRLCQDLGLIVSVLSLAYLLLCLPLGLLYNALLIAVNLSNKASMTMPDVYYVNMAAAGLALNLVAPAELLGPGFTRWPLWEYGEEAEVTLLILFDVASLVGMYSAALLSLDCYIERALPRTYMSSVYNTKHVCGFVWGGAALTSFSSLLFYVCSHVSTKMAECSKIQNAEAADAIMLFVGYLVPLGAVIYALALILRIGKDEPPPARALDPSGTDPSVRGLLLASVCAQVLLWTPFYATTLAHVLLSPQSAGRGGARGGGSSSSSFSSSSSARRFLRCLSVLLAFSSSVVVPLVYKRMNENFGRKVRELLRPLVCREQGGACPGERSSGQRAVT